MSFLNIDFPVLYSVEVCSRTKFFSIWQSSMTFLSLIQQSRTSAFTAEMIRWLNVKLAPCISIHGVLVDVYGVGVLIMGESGIGKSEAALELIKRGHRLVTDDVVEIRKVSDDTLVGSAPDITRHFIELRGIGIVDVKIHVRCTKCKRYTEYRSGYYPGRLETETRNMTDWDWKRSIQNFSATRWSATVFRSVRAGIWPLLLSLQQ